MKEDDRDKLVDEKLSRVPQKFNEDWLIKQLNDLDIYINHPKMIEKFFIGLRHTYVNSRDIAVIESYKEKFSAAT